MKLAGQLCCPLIRFRLQHSWYCCASFAGLHQCTSLGTGWHAGVPVLLRITLAETTCFSANDFGLFLSDEDPKKGIWLEAGKALDYYMLRNGVSIHPTSFQLGSMLARARSVEVVWVPALLPCIVPCSTPHPPHNCTEKTGAVGVMVGCEHPTLVPLLEAVLCACRTPWSTRRNSDL